MKRIVKPQQLFKLPPPGTVSCLSIYANSKDDLARLIGEAERIAKVDLPPEQVESLIAPVRFLAREKRIMDRTSSLGIFVREGFAGYLKIPFEAKSLAVVASSFHIKPLIKWQQRDKPFLILYFSADRALLYQGTMTSLKLVDEVSAKNFNSADSFIEHVDKVMWWNFGQAAQPIVLGGVQIACERFSNITRQRNVLQKYIGTFENELDFAELGKFAKSVLLPYQELAEAKLVQKFRVAKAKGISCANLKQIVQLAVKGEVKHLFVSEKLNIWGQINYRTGEFTYHSRQMNSKDDDILDDLAELVLLQQGQVSVLPAEKMPDGLAAAAILRNPLSLRREANFEPELRMAY